MENNLKKVTELALTVSVNLYEELSKRNNLDIEELCLLRMSAYIKSIGCDSLNDDYHSRLIMYKGIIECLLAIEMEGDSRFDLSLIDDLNEYANISKEHRGFDEFNKDYVKITNAAFEELPIVYDDCMLVECEKYLPDLSKAYKVLNVILHPNDCVYTYKFVEDEYDLTSLEGIIFSHYIKAVVNYNDGELKPRLNLESLIHNKIDSNPEYSKLLDLTEDVMLKLNSIIDILTRVDIFNGKEEYLLLIGGYMRTLIMDMSLDNKEAFNYKLSLVLELLATEYYTDTLYLDSDRMDLLMMLAGNTQARLIDIFDHNEATKLLDELYPLINKYKNISRENLEDYFLDNVSFLKENSNLDLFVEALLNAYLEFNDNSEEAEDDYYLFNASYISSDVDRYNLLSYPYMAYADGVEMIDNLALFELKYLNSILDKVEPMSKKSAYELKKVKRELPNKIKEIEEILDEKHNLIWNN